MRSHDPGCLVLRPPFFPSNQINKDSSVLHAPLPPASPSPHPCHEVTARRCQEAGWPLLGLAALLVSASLALSSFLPPLSPSHLFPLCHFVPPLLSQPSGPSLCPVLLASKLLAASKLLCTGASWEGLGRDHQCSLWLFGMWGGGGARGATSWFSICLYSDA